jgi:hypothetical protein
MDGSLPICAIAGTLGLFLALWASFEVKTANEGYLEAVVVDAIVDLACRMPAKVFDLGSVRFLVNITIFSLAAAWAGWGVRKP